MKKNEDRKLVCPYCGHDGEFEQARISFWVFHLFDLVRERRRARRTRICPECGTQITLPRLRSGGDFSEQQEIRDVMRKPYNSS